ncbi:hypothetical protein J4G02_01735 [Candidatus Poribacteria bacterium]|nr:hypothetical protein [Candidatus Poribacteria bacterium]
MSQDGLSPEIYKQTLDFLRIGNRAVKRAQEEDRKKGIPNVYSFNGHIYYELPNGELTKDKKIIDELLSAVEKKLQGKH